MKIGVMVLTKLCVALCLCCVLYPYKACAFVSTCGPRLECYTSRSKLDDACCPVMPGNSCGNDTSRQCDENFGYSCMDGVCKGDYNLTFYDVTYSTVTLSWNPFLPSGAKYEYNVLYVTSYMTKLSDWNVTGVGNMTTYVLNRLTPATRYFVRIGIWRQQTYTNLTEVAVVVTKAKDCVYSGRPVAVNERLLLGCEEACLCRPTGEFDCVGICQAGESEKPVCGAGLPFKDCCEEIPECDRNNCTYLGQHFLHEETWNIDCEENCTCFNGVVTCSPLCQRNGHKPNCSEMTLVKSDDGCCESWECVEQEERCEFRNNTYRTGSWFPWGKCEMCFCSPVSMETDCILLGHCGTVTVPPESVVCPKPMVLKNICCDTVVCRKDAGFEGYMDYYTVTKHTVTSLLIRFKFNASLIDVSLLNVIFFYTTDPTSEEHTSWTNITFSPNDILVLNNNTSDLKDLGKSNTLYSLDGSFMFVASNLKVDEFYYSKLGVEIKPIDPVNTEGSYSRKMVRQILLSDTVASFMTTYPDHSHDDANRVIFAASNITSSTALLWWNIPISYQINITSFVIKYKTFSERSWLYTKHLIFSDSSYLLKCLFDLKWYEVQLLAYPGENVLATTFFNTTEVVESNDERFTTQIKDVLIGHTYAIIRWEALDPSGIDNVINLEIQWSSGDNEEPGWKFCVPAESTSYTVDNLSPGTQFLAWVGTNLRTSRTAFSNKIHFVTTSYPPPQHSTSSHSLIAAITISCVSVFAMIAAIITVMYITRCRRRMAYETATSFENKIFQIYSQRDDQEC